LGIGVGYGAMRALKLLIPPFTLPRDVHVAMDGRVLAFACALSLVTAVGFGLVPALQATAPDLAGAMKEGGRGSAGDTGRSRVRSALVVVEVALAFVLLAGGGLLLRSFFQMMNMPLGFDATNVLTMHLPLANDRFADPSRLIAYVREIVA